MRSCAKETHEPYRTDRRAEPCRRRRLMFGFYPQLDLTISAPFHAMMLGPNNFAARIDPRLMLARDIGLWVGRRVDPARRGRVAGEADPAAPKNADFRAAPCCFCWRRMALGARLAGQCRAQGPLGPAAADRCHAVRRHRTFRRLVGSARRLPEQLLLCVRRCRGRVLDGGAGGAGAAAMAAHLPMARRWRWEPAWRCCA